MPWSRWVDLCKLEALELALLGDCILQDALAHAPHQAVHAPAQRARPRVEAEPLDDHDRGRALSQGAVDRALDLAGEPAAHAPDEGLVCAA